MEILLTHLADCGFITKSIKTIYYELTYCTFNFYITASFRFYC